MGCECATSRASAVVPIVRKTSFTFTKLRAGTALELCMVRDLDVSRFRSATLLVRVHAASIEGGRVDVAVRSMAPSAEDPAVDFVATPDLATVSFTDGTTAPSLEVVDLLPNMGESLYVTVRGEQDAGGVSTISLTLSADLVLHDSLGPRDRVAGDFTLDSADPTLTVGDGTGSPSAAWDKADGGTSVLAFDKAGASSMRVLHDTDESLAVQRFSGSWTNVLLAATTGLVTVAERLAVGAAPPDGDDQLVVTGSGGRVMFQSSVANTTTKDLRLGMRHYTIAEEPFIILRGFCDSTTNQLVLGGGTSNGNAATKVQINTAANSTTTSGTARWWIDSAGDITFRGSYNFDSASPVILVGKGTGSPVTTWDKVGTGSSTLAFKNASANNFQVIHTTAEAFKLQWWNSSSWDDVIAVDSSGNLDLAKPPQVQGASRIYSGSGAPAGGTGSNGDFYLRTDGAGGTALYYKSGGSWAAVA